MSDEERRKRRNLRGADREREIAGQNEQALQTIQREGRRIEQLLAQPVRVLPQLNPQLQVEQIVRPSEVGTMEDYYGERQDEEKSEGSDSSYSDEVYTPNTIKFQYGYTYITSIYQQMAHEHKFTIRTNAFNVVVQEHALRFESVRTLNFQGASVNDCLYYVALPTSFNSFNLSELELDNKTSLNMEFAKKDHDPKILNEMIEVDGRIRGNAEIPAFTIPNRIFIRIRLNSDKTIPERTVFHVIKENLAPRTISKALDFKSKSDEPPKKRERTEERT